nr:PAS domain S-box protein [Methanobacterium formicicum]
MENKVEERTRELNESEEKYRKLFEKNPDYNILFDTNGVIREVNEATVKMMGLSKDEIVGKKFTELESIPPENVSSILGELFRILEGKEIKPFESKFIDGNGDIHYIIIHAIPFLEKGKVERILGIGADITQLKKSRKQDTIIFK